MIAHPPAVSAVVVRAMTVAVRAYDRFRAYSGTLHCCCNPFSATGVVNRMDAGTDGRPEQEIDLGWCEGEEKQDPLYSGGEECWSVEFFGDYMALPLTAAEMPPPYPNILPGEGSPSPSPSPSPGSKTYVISGGSFISPYYDFSPALEPLEPGMTYTFEAAGIAANHPFVIAVAWGIVPEPLPTPFLQVPGEPLRLLAGRTRRLPRLPTSPVGGSVPARRQQRDRHLHCAALVQRLSPLLL